MTLGIPSFAAALDRWRIWLLRLAMSEVRLRALYLNRPARLFTAFVLCSVVMLGLSLYFPLWVLALGPAVYGVPHLVASLRYVDRAAGGISRGRALGLLTTVSVAIIGFRVATDLGLVSYGTSSESAVPEVVGMLLVFLGGVVLYRKTGWISLLGLAYFLPLLAGICFAPASTLGALILIHNVVAFAYWILGAPRGERWAPCLALVLFLGASAAIFLGYFDFLYRSFTPAGLLPWAALDFSEVGQSITPWKLDSALWFHAVVAYAFGQAVHYFIWMKAIPEQSHGRPVPTTFRESHLWLIRDLGPRLALGALVAVAVGAAAWLCLRYPTARSAYFAVAAFHGYLEIGALPLALIRGR